MHLQLCHGVHQVGTTTIETRKAFYKRWDRLSSALWNPFGGACLARSLCVSSNLNTDNHVMCLPVQIWHAQITEILHVFDCSRYLERLTYRPPPDLEYLILNNCPHLALNSPTLDTSEGSKRLNSMLIQTPKPNASISWDSALLG
jgi:hypothetical protein